MTAPLVEVEELRTHFPLAGGLFSGPRKVVRAVDGVSFSVNRGEVVGLVGESGSGKTTTGRSILRLTEPTSGAVRFDGVDITRLGPDQLRAYRKRMQIIFQDPFASLNPRMSVGDIVGQALDIHGLAKGSEREDRVAALLRQVGMSAAHMRRYPHEFSGGQRQRIGIARALAVGPDFIVADEPVSALDVSIRAQVVNLLQDLREELGLTLLFIAHDLSIVEYISDRVIVMYLGKIMESAPAAALYDNPRHPYTQALLSAVPIPDPTVRRERIILQGDIPSPIDPPSGCVFRTRCPIATAECAQPSRRWCRWGRATPRPASRWGPADGLAADRRKACRKRGLQEIAMLRGFIMAALLTATAPALAAERTARLDRETFACTSWAGWREYTQASLAARGARPNQHCPIRIPAGMRVTLIDEDAGAGAAEVEWRGRRWFVDAARVE